MARLKKENTMRKLLCLIGCMLGLLSIAQAQDRADRQQLSDPESFSMILLGDPQGYIKYDINQPLFDLCTAWIADNIDNLHIKAVLCTGDLVEQNENIVRNRKMLNQTSREMWENVWIIKFLILFQQEIMNMAISDQRME